MKLAQYAALGIIFALLATANGAGYRYGVSDQAFYIPVVVRALNPNAFPQDAALIDAQGRLMLGDEVLAAVVRTTGLHIDTVFFAAYLLSLGLMWAAIVAIGARVYTSAWGTIALGAVLTLRHRIPRTSANSFEPYFHPRMLAFSLGLLAIAALLRRRYAIVIALVAVSAVIHVTTALWFSMLLGVAIAVLEPRVRRLAVAIAAVGVLAGGWLFLVGPLNARMDDLWIQAVKMKDSLFATDWPIWAWLANLGLLGALWWMHRYRTARGRATAEEGALVWGATALVAFFLVTLPLVMAHIAFPVQLQISRVFWLVDALVAIYGLSLIHDATAMRVAAVILLVISFARAEYVMLVEQRERDLFSLHLVESPWTDAMHWLSTEPVNAHVLADPGHTYKYGPSVRVAAGRDVFLEEVKDSAIAIYSNAVAARVIERTYAIGDFTAMTAEHAKDLAKKYDLDYLVTEAPLALPVAYENDRFHIYRLKALDR